MLCKFGDLMTYRVCRVLEHVIPMLGGDMVTEDHPGQSGKPKLIGTLAELLGSNRTTQ